LANVNSRDLRQRFAAHEVDLPTQGQKRSLNLAVHAALEAAAGIP
jgi:tRNA(Leu) C34 or U34 (ribose-2'-O)-methylase TrmL